MPIVKPMGFNFCQIPFCPVLPMSLRVKIRPERLPEGKGVSLAEEPRLLVLHFFSPQIPKPDP